MKKLLGFTLMCLFTITSTCFANYEASSKFKYATDNDIKFTEITFDQVKQLEVDLKSKEDYLKRSVIFYLENTSKDTTYFIDGNEPMVLLKDGNDNNIVFKDSDGDPQIISTMLINKKMTILNPGDSVLLSLTPTDKYVDLQAKNIYKLRVSIEIKPAKYNYKKGNIDVPEEGTILEVLNLH